MKTKMEPRTQTPPAGFLSLSLGGSSRTNHGIGGGVRKGPARNVTHTGVGRQLAKRLSAKSGIGLGASCPPIVGQIRSLDLTGIGPKWVRG